MEAEAGGCGVSRAHVDLADYPLRMARGFVGVCPSPCDAPVVTGDLYRVCGDGVVRHVACDPVL